MSLGEVFVLADEDDDRIPEFKCLRFVLFQPISNDFCFTYVGLRIASLGIRSEKKVDTRAVEFLTGEKIFKFSSRCCERLAGLV